MSFGNPPPQISKLAKLNDDYSRKTVFMCNYCFYCLSYIVSSFYCLFSRPSMTSIFFGCHFINNVCYWTNNFHCASLARLLFITPKINFSSHYSEKLLINSNCVCKWVAGQYYNQFTLRLHMVQSARVEGRLHGPAALGTTCKAPMNKNYFPCILSLTQCYTAPKTPL